MSAAAGPRVGTGVGAARRRPSSPKAPAAGAGRERQMVVQRSEDGAGVKRLAPSVLPSMLRRRAELLRLRGGGGAGGNGNLQSLSVSCASEASNDSFCSRASTGRIDRPAGPHGGAARRRVTGPALYRTVQQLPLRWWRVR